MHVCVWVASQYTRMRVLECTGAGTHDAISLLVWLPLPLPATGISVCVHIPVVGGEGDS